MTTGRRLACLASIGLVWVLAAACTTAPPYAPPVTVPPPAFKELGPWAAAQPSDERLRGAWWEIFQDDQLNRQPGQQNSW